MKFLLLFLLFFQFSHSQNTIFPFKNNSFGLNNHTNRDIPYFTHTDQSKNTLIVGTTEKDSTFTDIILTKLDANYNEIWVKEVSIETNRSYDIPIKSYLNNNNELVIIGRSSLKESFRNGVIFLLKYDSNGNQIFKKNIGSIDGNNYVDYNHINIDFNEDDTINLIYVPIDYNTYSSNIFNFLKLDSSGNIIESFSKEIINEEVISIINNGTYYILAKKDEGSFNNYIYTFYKVQGENNESSFIINNNVFNSYYFASTISSQVKMTIDNNDNVYLTCNNITNNETKNSINLTKINNSNSIDYSINTSSDINNSLVGTFINEQNENIIITNNKSDNNISFLKVEENNQIIFSNILTNKQATGYKKNNDNSLFITTSNSDIYLVSENYLDIKKFKTSDSYELIDFSKIDDENISTIGISYAKMFPESDYFTQLNIEAEKIDSNNISNSYSFSGIGTSNAFQQKLIIDNDNNYIVLATEKMGPEYLGIGGVSAPLNNRIIKYDSDLNEIWETHIPSDIFNIIYSRNEVPYFLDQDNNLFMSLPKEGDYFGIGYDLYKITTNGELVFINESYPTNELFVDQNSIYVGKNYSTQDNGAFFILNKETGNLVKEIEIGKEDFLSIFSIDNDFYFYTVEQISGSNDIIYLYKNGNRLFSKTVSGNFDINIFEIDNEGGITFASSGYTNYINKIGINNSYIRKSVSDDVEAFKKYDNGNYFIYLDDETSIITDNNLNFLRNGDEFYAFNPYLMNWGDYILLGISTNEGNVMWFINEFGNITHKFDVSQGFLHDWYSKIDYESNLIIVGAIGDRISTNNEYKWSMGFINKYGKKNDVLNVPEYISESNLHELIVYPNPAIDYINISLSKEEIKSINIFDLNGKLIEISNTNKTKIKHLKKGIYIIKTVSNSNKVYISKFIK